MERTIGPSGDVATKIQVLYSADDVPLLQSVYDAWDPVHVGHHQFCGQQVNAGTNAIADSRPRSA